MLPEPTAPTPSGFQSPNRMRRVSSFDTSLVKVVLLGQQQELERVNQEQSEQLQLKDKKIECLRLNLNKSIEDISELERKLNDTINETTTADETAEIYQDQIKDLKAKINSSQKSIERNDKMHAQEQEDMQKQVDTLTQILNVKIQAITELTEENKKINIQIKEIEESSTEALNSKNKSIAELTEEIKKLTILNENSLTEITKIEAEKTMLQADTVLQADHQETITRLQRIADMKSQELQIASKKLNMERAQRASNSNLYKTTTKRNQKMEVKNAELFGEVQDLQRELAASRMETDEIRKFIEKQSFGRKIGKLLCW